MTTVKECYIAVCGEKDTLETTLRQMFAHEQQMREDKVLLHHIILKYF